MINFINPVLFHCLIGRATVATGVVATTSTTTTSNMPMMSFVVSSFQRRLQQQQQQWGRQCYHYQHSYSSSSSLASSSVLSGGLASTTRNYRLCLVPPFRQRKHAVATTTTTAIRSITTTTTSSREDSNAPFVPSSPPPGTHGTPVFPDIDLLTTTTRKENNNSESTVVTTTAATIRNEDPYAIFVVTGASRGIGLQCVKSLVDRTKGTVVACCRSPDDAHHLHSFVNSLNGDESNNNRDRVMIAPSLDLECQDSIVRVANAIKDRFFHANKDIDDANGYGKRRRIDLLLNVAGILGDGGKTTPGPERSISKLDRSWFEKTMAVNCIGPVMFTKELVPLMTTTKRPKQRNNNNNTGSAAAAAVIANVSARVGSISDNNLGGWYSYRMSKTALNQATRTLALELRRSNIWCLSLHPGTTNTNLSEPFSKNVKDGMLFPVQYTAPRLLDIIDSMTEQHSGGFYDWAGKSLSF